jgi:hypothetical protein
MTSRGVKAWHGAARNKILFQPSQTLTRGSASYKKYCSAECATVCGKPGLTAWADSTIDPLRAVDVA